MRIQANVKSEARQQTAARPKVSGFLSFFAVRRRLREIESDLSRLKARIENRDALIDDREGGGSNARPPEGDDYNELYEDVSDTLRRLGI